MRRIWSRPVLDSCWFELTSVESCQTRVDSCRTRFDLCQTCVGSCWFVLTRYDLCWNSYIRIDLMPYMFQLIVPYNLLISIKWIVYCPLYAKTYANTKSLKERLLEAIIERCCYKYSKKPWKMSVNNFSFVKVGLQFVNILKTNSFIGAFQGFC